MLAAAAAPAIVKADSLMKLWVPPQDLILETGLVFPKGVYHVAAFDTDGNYSKPVKWEPNELPDYEEGVFTPTIVGAGALSYEWAEGHYTRIGNDVRFSARLKFSGAKPLRTRPVNRVACVYGENYLDVIGHLPPDGKLKLEKL